MFCSFFCHFQSLGDDPFEPDNPADSVGSDRGNSLPSIDSMERTNLGLSVTGASNGEDTENRENRVRIGILKLVLMPNFSRNHFIFLFLFSSIRKESIL